jgi:hypothetical protein
MPYNVLSSDSSCNSSLPDLVESTNKDINNKNCRYRIYIEHNLTKESQKPISREYRIGKFYSIKDAQDKMNHLKLQDIKNGIDSDYVIRAYKNMYRFYLDKTVYMINKDVSYNELLTEVNTIEEANLFIAAHPGSYYLVQSSCCCTIL